MLNRKEGMAAFLAGAQGENPYSAANAKKGLGDYLTKKGVDTAEQLKTDPEYKDVVNNGGSLAVDPETGKIAIGGNPYLKLNHQNDVEEAKARKFAMDTYGKGSKDLQDKASAIQEMGALTNDPNNPGSLGQARTMALKAMGMKRYNGDEASAVVPQNLQGWVSSLFNRVGNDGTPIDETDRKMLNQFGKTMLDTTVQQHENLKQQALGNYQMSSFAKPENIGILQNQLGAPLSQQLGQMQGQYKQLPATQGPNMTQKPNPNALQQGGSFLDKVGSGIAGFLGGPKKPPMKQALGTTSASAPAQPQAAPQQPMVGGGKVRVSNGNETLEIDSADLPHAAQDGYKPVGQ